jgi:hypothetical protein
MGGFGSIEAMTAGATVGSSGTGAIVAVQGRGTEAPVSQFFGAAGSPLAIVGAGSHSSPGFRVNAITARRDGGIDVAGTEGGQAAYLQVVTQTGNVLYENYFDLSCPNGTAATTSALDEVIPAPPTYSDDDTLVLGRADCGSVGRVSMIERVSDIRFLASSRIKAYSKVGTSTNCSDSFATAPCISSYLTVTGDAANSVLAMTPNAFLAHVDGNSGTAQFQGDETNAAAIGYPTVVPTSAAGASPEYPYLVGLSLTSDGMPGVRRIAIDRIFTDGGGELGP